ncbi:hypothetical protein [Pradoshia eiseniae]|uniref:hypothetical protein n=1 Tax=Pradoshia eiseniae TaxID=2064768 RepID=UPI0011B079E2|nr:hypothetical protein [Pradoshia eiseniae]
MGKRWESSEKAHPMPMQRVQKVGEVWTKAGKSQAKPTLCPCKGYEGWGKGGPKLGEAKQ